MDRRALLAIGDAYHRSPMLIPRATLGELAARLEAMPAGLRAARAEVDIDPLDLVRSGAGTVGFSAFFSSPDGRSIGALGAAQRIGASGPGRLHALDDGISSLEAGVPALVGFSFGPDGPSSPDWDGFDAAAAVIPEITVIRSGGRSRLTFALPPGSDGRSLFGLAAPLQRPAPARPVYEGADHTVESRPSPSDWMGLVEEATSAIAAGEMRKVVLARSVVVRAVSPIDPFDLVAQLRDRYPGCWVFGWQEGSSAFIGASPELLVAREGTRFRVEPLAGSARRGTDPAEDRRLGDALLASGKEQMEHAIVVEDALRRLEPLARSLQYPAEPQLHRFATVQHLSTPIGGITEARLLTIAEALHPTPAVGGDPRAAALGFIEKVEGLDRGWYAGGIGWADSSGDGEIALGLRCALVQGERATLFAGNGIVADSEPQAELEESRLKLQPILELLTAV